MENVLIIGGGVAGLSAGIYAGLKGLRATVCERLPVAGGCLSAWDRRGFTVDNCIHWLTGTNPRTALYKLWKDLGVLGRGGEEIRKRDCLFTAVEGEETLSLSRDPSLFEKRLLALAPEEEKEISALCRAVAAMRDLEGVGGPGCDRKRGFLPALLSAPELVRYALLSAEGLSERFRHPLIRRFLRDFMPEGFGALALIYTMAVFTGEDGDLPRGGSRAMAENMTARFLETGGALLPGKEAVRIETGDGRAKAVVFRDGSRLPADNLILTLDPARIFGELLERPMPRDLQKQYQNPALRRFSAFHAAFAAETPSLPFTGDLILPLPGDFPEEARGRAMLLRNASGEEETAPAGKSLIQTMIYLGEEQAKAFIALRERDINAYRRLKERLCREEEALLLRRFPELRGKLSLLDAWTPASYKRYVASEIGSFMSFTLPERLAPRALSGRVPGLRNVRLAGQWLRLPGGLPMAAESGRDAALYFAKKAGRA